MRIGNYELVRMIGEGGFGRTYEARHVLLGEKACLKQNRDISNEDAELLIREARLMWNLNHHSLPSMRDFFEWSDGSYVLAMQFIEGNELQRTIANHGALEAEEVCWIYQRLLNALHYLHMSGVIHGDVKPANVIVQPASHNAVLVDYGLASMHPRSISKAAGYTALYAAPEIMAGKPSIPESDLYSLALTMLASLGGDPIAMSIPKTVDRRITGFITDFLRFNPLDRPSWDSCDLVRKLSDVRCEVFGRRTSLA